ncbi:MAG TPA: T9SS type A sorting domain-containing protein [Puia sp.]|nr:T9SS type A sorting domain-containing protein [Puia sp.]
MKSKRTLFTLALAALVANTAFCQEVAEQNVTPSLLLSFTGSADGSCADLAWVTENETNSRWFVVERAGADGGFDSIAVVMGINNGNTTNYSFSDENMLPGTNCYRLREVDMGGVQRFSKVIRLENGQSAADRMGLYPNPAVATINYTVTASASQEVLVQIYSLTGVMVSSSQQELQAGSNLETVSINNLRAGNYVLKVSSQSGSFHFVQPFVKVI